MLDGENKDLTMESDFLGMFNPVRGLKKKENSGSNPESPSLTVENLAPLLIDALYEHIDYRNTLKDFIADRECVLKPLFVTDCNFLVNKLNEDELAAHADLMLEAKNYSRYQFDYSLIQKSQSLGQCYNMFINAKLFSIRGIEVYFNNTHTISDTPIHIQALDIPEVLYNLSNLDSSLDPTDQIRYLEDYGFRTEYLTGDNAVIDIDITSPDNPTTVYGNVPVNSDAIVEGLNKLTGTYDANAKSFSIYINDTLYTTINNVNKWNNKLEIIFEGGIDHIVYSDTSRSYQESTVSLPDNIKGFNNQYFTDGTDFFPKHYKSEISLETCFIKLFVEWYFSYKSDSLPFMLNYNDLEQAVYYFEDTFREYGLYRGLVISRYKHTNSDCANSINILRDHLNICLGKAQPW